MASEMVKMATDDKLKETDWGKNIEICELVSLDQGKAKDVIKSIKKRLGSKSANTQLYAVMLLEMLMNNCGENIHKLVIDNSLLPILVKIVKKKNEFPVRERTFLLLDATQTSLGGLKGKFPQYYNAYYELVAAGVEFPNRPRVTITDLRAPPAQRNVPPLTSQNSLSNKFKEAPKQVINPQPVPDSSIIKKAVSVLEILRDVLNSIDPQRAEGAMDEFVLDLVEQCSFQKQRIMHLVMTSRDEKIVTEAIEINEELHKVLIRHDSLLSVGPTSTIASFMNNNNNNYNNNINYNNNNYKNNSNNTEEEEEDAESIYKRIRKGKALSIDYSEDRPTHPFGSITEEMLRRPLIRPLTIKPDPSATKPDPLITKPDPLTMRPDPLAMKGDVVRIPPPPAKQVERDRFFREKDCVAGVTGQMGDLGVDRRDGSSSCSGSTDFGD